jgi:serine/threonine protein kinase
MGGATGLRPGELFVGRYQIRQLLGQGDRKRTFLAFDQRMDRLVAISFVKPEAARDDPEGTEREAKVLGRIGRHANIVSLYDFDVNEDGTIEYMIFEYLSGGTLAEHLKDSGKQSLDEVLRLGRQLSRGLAHLHRRGLIHRDVSPDNVWLDEHHVAHLGDFDSAIPATGADDLRPVTTNSFAAPEERAGGLLDQRSDLYSLGGILYVAATGADRPGDAGLLRAKRPDFPSAFGDLTAELLSESPEDRPADAETVLERLNEIRYTSNVDTLIASGEGDKIEFKASLHHPYESQPPDPRKPKPTRKEIEKILRKSITKTVAAFLNSEGGTLLIGVADLGSALGIEPDFEYLTQGKQNADGWLLSLQEAIINALGAEVWNAVRVSLVLHGSQTIAVVSCPPRTIETWHREDGGERFYIRAANGTRELNGPSLLSYIREHWPI